MKLSQKLFFVFYVLWTAFKGAAYASHCPGNSIDIFPAEHQQNLIKIVDATTSGQKEAKKVTSVDSILVPGLTLGLFQQIVNDPDLIAQIMGGKLISMNNKSDFVIEIPGILGFDLRFNVRTKVISKNKLSVDLSDFNTFFYKGEGTVRVQFSSGGNATLYIDGDAFIPRTPAKVFIWGVGGEENFKNMLQAEIEKQTTESLQRFQVISESIQ